jgi:hypothetical protein
MNIHLLEDDIESVRKISKYVEVNNFACDAVCGGSLLNQPIHTKIDFWYRLKLEV